LSVKTCEILAIVKPPWWVPKELAIDQVSRALAGTRSNPQSIGVEL
jgi:hypothetical protein